MASSMPMRRLVLGLALSAAACSDDGTDPDPGGGIRLRVVASPGATDTITATPVQGLVLEVRTESGGLASGAIVRFSSLPASDGFTPSMFLGSATGQSFSTLVAETANGQGRAIARVQFGPIAGPVGIEITVPEFGLADTVHFTVLPGRPSTVHILPQDTTASVGKLVQFSAAVVDRFQNPRADPVAYRLFSFPASAGTVSQTGRVTATRVGRIGIEVTAGADLAIDTAFISVVPRGILAAMDLSELRLVTIALDGSGREVLSAVQFSSDLEPEWSPDGTEIVVSPSGVFREVHRVRPGAPILAVVLPELPDLGVPYWPSYSPDGQLLYFTNGPSGFIWRVGIDGSGAESVTSGGLATEYRPTISPDGRYVAFHTVADGAFEVVIRVWDRQTGSLTGTKIPGRFPEWAPAGDSIAYLENDTGRLRLMHRDGGGSRLIVAPGNGRFFDGQMAWSPDGQFLVASGETGLEVIEVATGLRLPLTFSGSLRHPAWKPGS